MTAEIEQRIDRYEILEEIGRGGMAVVYRGRDTTLDREVAVKVLHPHLADRPDSRRRFAREAKAVAKLNHHNILEIYDYSGLDSPKSYIVTEFIHGTTLKEFVETHPLRHPEIAEMIALDVSHALAHAHSTGIIHRDIKPENIMIRSDGVLKLMDFGIAQMLDVAQLTVTGALIGSPAHMSPEAIEGKPQDVRSDVFSLGTLLYFLATARLPFNASNAHAMFKKIVDANYDDPQKVQPLVGMELRKIIGRALHKEPERRQQSVSELVTELENDLWSAGLVDPQKELQQFFVDPERYQRSLHQRLCVTLFQKGQAAAKSRKIAVALDYFNRLLTLDEHHQGARGALEGLTQERRVWSRLLVGLLALGAVAFGVYWFGFSGPESPFQPPPEVKEQPRPIRPAPAPLSRTIDGTMRAAERHWSRARDAMTTRELAAEAPRSGRYLRQPNVRLRKRDLPGNGQRKPPIPTPPVPNPLATPILVTIKALPISATIEVDRRQRGDGILRGLKLKPGVHVISLSVPRIPWLQRTTYRLTVAASDKSRTVIYSVNCRPGRIVLVGAVESALATWDGGRGRGRPGKPIVVPMGRYRPGQLNAPSRQITLTVTLRSGQTSSTRFGLAAGQTFRRTF